MTLSDKILSNNINEMQGEYSPQKKTFQAEKV